MYWVVLVVTFLWGVAEVRSASMSHRKANVSLFLDSLDVERHAQTEEQRLIQMLFDSYEKAVRPVIQSSATATVAIGLTLIHIFQIHEKKQFLSLNAWLEQEWNDERFIWNPELFGNVKELSVPYDFVWTPDIVLYNNAIDFAQGLMKTNVIISSNGNCLYAPPAKLRSMCKLDVTFFPFDHQICQLRFGSWIYDGWELNVTLRADGIRMDSYTDNGEWAIVDTEVLRHVNYYTCCGDTPFPEVQFRIHLRRRTLFYVYNIIIPCVMLVILVLLQFHLPSDSSEKVTFGLTVLLAYSVYSFKIEENMPETSDVIPLIAIFVVCNMSISAISVTFSVIVLCMHHGAAHQRRVPSWLRKLTQNIIAPIVCWKVRRPNKGIESLMQSLITCMPGLSPKVRKKQQQKGGKRNSSSLKRIASHLTLAETQSGNGSFLKLQRQVVESALSEISFIKYQFDTEALEKELVYEWQQVAIIFDKFCFLIAVILSVGVTFCLLLIAPLFSKGKLHRV